MLYNHRDGFVKKVCLPDVASGINVSTECLKTGKACYFKQCMCPKPIKLSHLIGPNDVRYNITNIPAICLTKHHFRRSNKWFVH